jgi:hypothetical protein
MFPMGTKHAKLSLDFGFSYKIGGYRIDEFYGSLYFPYYLNAGITLNLFNR